MATRILVVDDSEVERQLVRGLLIKNSDFEVELAENGRQALQRLADRTCDVVISDLVMPEMDGLELVRAVRKQYPQIPTVLMTAYGDESIAMDALEAGAASYIPKARQAERLMETVQRVADHAAADQIRKRLRKRVIDYHCRYSLENDPRLIRALAAESLQVMAHQNFGDLVERIRICEALEESLLNAMYHGNLELSRGELERARMADGVDELVRERLADPPFAERKILVVVHVSPCEARFVIRDEGRGFRRELVEGDDVDRFERGACRGMTLIKSLMDEVAYNSQGNELTIRKAAAATV